jgi:MFS transporter, LPLT family, lysophospholipid transporter
LIAGVMAGLFLIPLNAALQAESHQDKLGKTIATQNSLENLAMLAGSLFAFTNVSIGFDPSQLFFALAALVAIVVSVLRIPQRAAVQVLTPEYKAAL